MFTWFVVSTEALLHRKKDWSFLSAKGIKESCEIRGKKKKAS